MSTSPPPPGPGEDGRCTQHPELHPTFRLVAGSADPTDSPSAPPFPDPRHRDPGTIDKRVILQTELWVDSPRMVVPLPEMTTPDRANVLRFLDAEAATWVAHAHAWTVIDAIYGRISAVEAVARLERLDLLPTGWAHHTPLGHHLHLLNQSTPKPMKAPVPPAPAETAHRPEALRDTDHGSWLVRTASTTTYVIDLDDRRVMRVPTAPGAAAGSARRAREAGFHVTSLPFDGEWVSLEVLLECRVGRALVTLDGRPGGGYRHSTPVIAIERL